MFGRVVLRWVMADRSCLVESRSVGLCYVSLCLVRLGQTSFVELSCVEFGWVQLRYVRFC